MLRDFFKTLAAILGGLILIILVSLTAFLYLNAAPALPPHSTDSVTIEKNGKALIEIKVGESAISVGNRLQDAGLIKSGLLWKVLSRLENDFIKTGTYTLETPLSQIAIYKIFKDGKQILTRVTIPEGVTLSKIARILEEKEICSADDFFRACRDRSVLSAYQVPGQDMQGYLFPDTYLFQPNYPAIKVVKEMADTFFDNLIGLNIDIGTMTPDELYKKVTLASIIEREYRIRSEAPIMAGVFQNRLSIGMRLESCATVEYIITEIQGKPHPERLFNRDTQIQNSYNTYIRAGLPPGPISEPGLVSLEAAFFPEKNDYLFFRVVAPAEGRHYFSKTLDDHIKAGILYVKAAR